MERYSWLAEDRPSKDPPRPLPRTPRCEPPIPPYEEPRCSQDRNPLELVNGSELPKETNNPQCLAESYRILPKGYRSRTQDRPPPPPQSPPPPRSPQPSPPLVHSVDLVQQTITTTTDQLLQNGDRGSQLQDGLLQPSYSTLAGLESILLETRQGLEVHDLVLQKTDVFQMTVNAVMHHLPLLPEDHIVFLDGVFNSVGCGQDLLTMLLGVGLDMMNLCHMSSPFHLSIVHL